MGRSRTKPGIERSREKRKCQNPAARVRLWCRVVYLPSVRFRCTLGRMLAVRYIEVPKSVGAVTKRPWEDTSIHYRGPERICPLGAPGIHFGAPGRGRRWLTLDATVSTDAPFIGVCSWLQLAYIYTSGT